MQLIVAPLSGDAGDEGDRCVGLRDAGGDDGQLAFGDGVGLLLYVSFFGCVGRRVAKE